MRDERAREGRSPSRDGHTIPYVVIGNSGYHNLHLLASDAKAGELADGLVFEYGDAGEYGFLALSVSGGKISGGYTGVSPGIMPDGSDAKVTSGEGHILIDEHRPDGVKRDR